MMKIKSLLLATMALAITADAAANVEMSIFKKKKKKAATEASSSAKKTDKFDKAINGATAYNGMFTAYVNKKGELQQQLALLVDIGCEHTVVGGGAVDGLVKLVGLLG